MESLYALSLPIADWDYKGFSGTDPLAQDLISHVADKPQLVFRSKEAVEGNDPEYTFVGDKPSLYSVFKHYNADDPDTLKLSVEDMDNDPDIAKFNEALIAYLPDTMSPSDKHEVVFEVDKAIKKATGEPTSTGDSTATLSKEENVSDIRKKRIEHMRSSWGPTDTQKRRNGQSEQDNPLIEEHTVSDARQKNIVSALLEHRL